jgi:hypothetical protein
MVGRVSVRWWDGGNETGCYWALGMRYTSVDFAAAAEAAGRSHDSRLPALGPSTPLPSRASASILSDCSTGTHQASSRKHSYLHQTPHICSSTISAPTLSVDPASEPSLRHPPHIPTQQAWCVDPALSSRFPTPPCKTTPQQPHHPPMRTADTTWQADSLTEEQVSEFKEAFSLFVSPSMPLLLCCCLAPESVYVVPKIANSFSQDKDGDG